MGTSPKLIPSGIERKASSEAEFAEMARGLGAFVENKINNFFYDLIQMQSYALERLAEWTPTERLLDLKEAAAYLKVKPRTLDSWTNGSKPLIQFTKLGGRKRFKKLWLDNAVDNGSVKPRVVKL